MTGAEPAATAADDLAGARRRIALSTGIAMAYVDVGPPTGRPVVLIHGFTDNIRSWWPTMRALHRRAPDLRILAIDLRGHGASDMPPAEACAAAPEACFKVADLAADVIAFLAGRGIPRATLAGHSLGSFVVQEIALSRPELVDRAVLVATSTTCVGNPALRDFVLKELIEGAWKPALEARGKTYPRDFYELTPLDADPHAADWLARNWVADPAAAPAFLEPYVPETARVRLGGWIGAARALLATDHGARLTGLVVPTLVLWATQDNIFLDEPDQAAIRRALAAAAKAHGEVHYWKQYGQRPLPASGVPDSDIGHNVQWGAAETVAADIECFMRTGAPTMDLARSDEAPNLSRIVTEPGKAKLLRFGP
jgi:pimeloyl-ACP methyl ester carboxylesterase